MVAGDSFTRSLILKESDGTLIDLSGLTGRAQIRVRAGSPTVLADFTVSIPTPANGEVIFSLTTIQTRALPGCAVWDLELDGGDTNTHTVVAGDVTVTPDVTVA